MALRNRWLLVTLLTLGSLIATSFAASPIQAAKHTSSLTPTKAGNHCVVQLDPLLPGQVSSNIRSFKCFTTLSASIAAATSGRVNLPASASGQDVAHALQRQAQANTIQPNTTNVIAIFFVDANFSGSSLTFQTSGPPCSSTVTYGLSSMPSGWNDVISSVEGGFDGCTWYRLWVDTNFGGASQCYSNDTSFVGSVMNDQTSSVYFRIANPC